MCLQSIEISQQQQPRQTGRTLSKTTSNQTTSIISDEPANQQSVQYRTIVPSMTVLLCAIALSQSFRETTNLQCKETYTHNTSSHFRNNATSLIMLPNPARINIRIMLDSLSIRFDMKQSILSRSFLVHSLRSKQSHYPAPRIRWQIQHTGYISKSSLARCSLGADLCYLICHLLPHLPYWFV